MEELKGRFNTAIAYVPDMEKITRGQILALCNAPFTEGMKIRIMPDAHAGKGCVIGTTMTIHDKIVPNLVSVDIGCGMETVKLGESELDFARLDKVIKKYVPCGKGVRRTEHPFAAESRVLDVSCEKEIFTGAARENLRSRALRSIGTLGGGNHFIEVAKDQQNGNHYLIIHSGSRNPGLSVAQAHQKKAQRRHGKEVPRDLAWLEGDDFDAYMRDMHIMQEYADINRRAIADEILRGMEWEPLERFSTIHNYVNFEDMILRKGAVSAKLGERLLIPFNMRDGSVICEGLGNKEWNCSAPHGAGRQFSRQDAFSLLNLKEFKEQMSGIYSTSIGRATLDESPGAYKARETIIAAFAPTARITHVLKPVYNFKASGG